MRILHVTTSIGLKGAGVSASLAQLTLAQADAGANVAVFGLTTANNIEEDLKSWNGASARIFPTLGPEKFGYAPYLAKAIARQAPDIVHLHGMWAHTGKVVADWAEKSGTPYVVSVHGMLAPVALRFSQVKKRVARKLFVNRVIARAAAFHATSSVERGDIRRFGVSVPVLEIPHGINQPSVCAEIKQLKDHFTVLSLGRLHPVKGLDQLITAWAGIEQAFPSWRLRIVGPDDVGYGANLKAKIEQLGLRNIQIHPPVYGAVKEKVMAEADLFVLPSLTENFAMTVAESLAAGVPVIASKAAPWQGLETEHCGWWIDHGSAPLIDALITAMSLPEFERRQMGSRGKDWMARDFSLEGASKNYLDAYEWLLSGGVKPTCVSLD
jgi:glycosyltransferase involved in cell wall biosynthesis